MIWFAGVSKIPIWLAFLVVAHLLLQDRISDDLPFSALLYGNLVQPHQTQGQDPGE